MNRTFCNKIYSAYDVLCIHADMTWSTLRTLISLRFQGCHCGHNFRSTGTVRVKARAAESILIGESVRLLGSWRSNRVGLSSPVILHTWQGGRIEIGDRTGASSVAISSRSGSEHRLVDANLILRHHLSELLTDNWMSNPISSTLFIQNHT